MAHRWVQVQQGAEGIHNYGKRKCLNCGAEQTKDATHLWWGRVTEYRWLPLAGRCKSKGDDHE